MSFLPQFCLPSTSCKSVILTGPSTPLLELCLDLHVHTLEDSSIGSLYGNIDGNSCVDMDNSKFKDMGTGSSCANTPGNTDSPATSRHIGSFHWDWEEGSYSLEWPDLAEFELWQQMEECLCCIEFVASTSQTNGILWSRWQCFVCGHQKSRGGSTYEKKHPEQQCKIKTKKSGCNCHIDIKQYPHTSTILGHYIDGHDHNIGAANIAYTCLSGAI